MLTEISAAMFEAVSEASAAPVEETMNSELAIGAILTPTYGAPAVPIETSSSGRISRTNHEPTWTPNCWANQQMELSVVTAVDEQPYV